MINRILELFESEKAKGHYDFNSVIGEKNVWQKAIDIVQEVAREYDAFDVIYKKVCELEKRYDEDTDVGNVNGCIRLENLLQYFKEELKAPYQKAPSRCDTCTHYVADEVPPICYMCSKGIEDNYEKGE